MKKQTYVTDHHPDMINVQLSMEHTQNTTVMLESEIEIKICHFRKIRHNALGTQILSVVYCQYVTCGINTFNKITNKNDKVTIINTTVHLHLEKIFKQRISICICILHYLAGVCSKIKNKNKVEHQNEIQGCTLTLKIFLNLDLTLNFILKRSKVIRFKMQVSYISLQESILYFTIKHTY